MVKTPDVDQFPFSPFQVFQYKITPETIVKFSRRYIRNKYGVSGPYNVERQVYANGRRVARASAYHEISSKFNVPYYKSKIGGELTRLNTVPDLFTIAIGILNKNQSHKSADFGGKYYQISYIHLFEALDAAGYKPLEVLLENEDAINREVEKCVDGVIKKHSSLSRETFRSALSEVGRKWVDEVKNYIVGGDAPPLSKETVKIRGEKFEENPSLYASGLNSPLFETGALSEAITFQVFVDQTDDIRSYIKTYRAGLKQEKKFAEAIARMESRGRIHDFHGLGEDFWKSMGLSDIQSLIAAKNPRKQRIKRIPIPFSDTSILRGLNIKTWDGATAKDIVRHLYARSAIDEKKGQANTFRSVFGIAYDLLKQKSKLSPFEYDQRMMYAKMSGMITDVELDIMREAISYVRERGVRRL